jgi:hypothetical protein
MKKPAIAAISAVVVGVFIVGALVLLRNAGGDDASSDPNSSSSLASSFPVPAGATVAFPDNVKNGIATKGWRAAGTLNEACATWREAYRNWIDRGQAGSITGDDEDGRRCTLSGPKAGHIANLSVTVYGTDTTPQVTLTVHVAVR